MIRRTALRALLALPFAPSLGDETGEREAALKRRGAFRRFLERSDYMQHAHETEFSKQVGPPPYHLREWQWEYIRLRRQGMTAAEALQEFQRRSDGRRHPHEMEDVGLTCLVYLPLVEPGSEDYGLFDGHDSPLSASMTISAMTGGLPVNTARISASVYVRGGVS